MEIERKELNDTKNKKVLRKRKGSSDSDNKIKKRRPFTPIKIDNAYLAETDSSDSFINSLESEIKALKQKRMHVESYEETELFTAELVPLILESAPLPEDLLNWSIVQEPVESDLVDFQIGDLLS